MLPFLLLILARCISRKMKKTNKMQKKETLENQEYEEIPQTEKEDNN